MQRTRPSTLRLAFRWRSATCEKTRRAVVVDRCARRRRGGSGDPLLCSTEALLPAPQTSAAARAVDYRSTDDRFLWTGRVATTTPPLSLQSIAVHLVRVCERQRGSRGRVLGTCLERALIRGLLDSTGELVCHCASLGAFRAHITRASKHERAARFKSSVSYNSSTLKHDSQEQLCSKGATPLQRHHSTTDATASANDASHPHTRRGHERQDPP